jgi:hypothetical protein
MQPFDIFFAEFQWKGCNDRRPWLIVELITDGCFDCFPISGQDYGGTAFGLDQTHPDFAATGLSKSCFIHDERFYRLTSACLKRRKGVLTGQLLTLFLKHAGLQQPKAP